MYYKFKGVGQADRGPVNALIAELKKHDDILLQFVDRNLIVQSAMAQFE